MINRIIHDMIQDGKTTKEIAEHLGTSSQFVAIRINAMTSDIDNRILELQRQGKSLAQIARDMKMGQSTVSRRLRRLGRPQKDSPYFVNRFKKPSR